MGGLKRAILIAIAARMLAGCAATFDQVRSEQARARADAQRARTELQERDNYTACVNQGALPGTPENLTCQLELAKKQQPPPAKPQSHAAKAP